VRADRYTHEDIDLTPIVAKPLYFGLFVNIGLPVALLMLCYYLSNHQLMESKVSFQTANLLVYIFGAMAVGEAALAVWLRGRLLNQPMVRRKETMEQDLVQGFARVCRPVFLIIASISIYGYVYFFLTGHFEIAVVFVLGSFAVFQIVRPRFGLVRKVVDRQLELVEQGKFLRMLGD
jgi:hypothetical protein